MTTSNNRGVPGIATPTNGNYVPTLPSTSAAKNPQAKEADLTLTTATTVLECDMRPPARALKPAECKESLSAFSKLREPFAKNGMSLWRKGGRDREFLFVVVRDKQILRISSLSELAAMLWAIGGHHA